MRAPLGLLLIVAKIIAVSFIHFTFIDQQENHHFAVESYGAATTRRSSNLRQLQQDLFDVSPPREPFQERLRGRVTVTEEDSFEFAHNGRQRKQEDETAERPNVIQDHHDEAKPANEQKWFHLRGDHSGIVHSEETNSLIDLARGSTWATPAVLSSKTAGARRETLKEEDGDQEEHVHSAPVEIQSRADLGSHRRECTKAEYRQFMLALLHEFNENSGLMFHYFDLNRDRRIEARELWPRPSATGNPDDYNEDENDDYDDNQKTSKKICDGLCQQNSISLDEENEFAFEPHFNWNPCSLSHMLLYEDKLNLTQETLADAFSKLKAANSSRSTTSDHRDQVRPSGVERISTEVIMRMGESKVIDCLPEQLYHHSDDSLDEPDCLWTRYGANLGTVRDEHVALERRANKNNHSRSVGTNRQHSAKHALKLHLKDAQLYLSGPYECSCNRDHSESNSLSGHKQQVVHSINIQVLAQPRVTVRPSFQWSLPNSRIAFECHHDYIDTSPTQGVSRVEPINDVGESLDSSERSSPSSASLNHHKLRWLHNNLLPVVDGKEYEKLDQSAGAPCSSRASITLASGRLVLERVQTNDTGRYYCVVVEEAKSNLTSPLTSTAGKSYGQLLIQDQPPLGSLRDGAQPDTVVKHLLLFHENGISVYKLQADDGQELELVRELSGHSQVSSEVDGNWNQLTLCGGLNPDQVVICEWSDNALVIEAQKPSRMAPDDDLSENELDKESTRDPSQEDQRPARKYIYVGQPNLNRVVVLDGQVQEIVAIINTEPQPRKLFAFKPNKIHLSKWVRRRLSPIASARWLKAIEEQQQQHNHRHQQNTKHQRYQQQQSQAHPLRLTPASSRLYSDKRHKEEEEKASRRFGRHLQEHRPTKLVQHDIWLLCYGRALVVDPTSDLSDLPEQASSSNDSTPTPLNSIERPFVPLVAAWPLIGPHWTPSISRARKAVAFRASPMVSAATSQAYRAGTEARLRNRKSVQIIQSTFFPASPNKPAHRHDKQQQTNTHATSDSPATRAVNEFKRLTVLTTHYVIEGRGMSSLFDDERSYLGRATGTASVGAKKTRASSGGVAHFDLVESLTVPQTPYSQEGNPRFKLHHAYVTHYDERQLYRVSMDSYRYDKQIDLQQCDPVHLISAAQGLLIVQCRSLITHRLIGQMVLDELTSQQIQFNANVNAQKSYLTPDNQYLISIYTNKSSIIYVQSVKVDGLKLLYEIKTSLESVQCSFVWRDGYYAAIFVALNRHDKQTELLSLRLADSRLELIARVPGQLNPSAQHKEPLNVEPELQMASLSTDSGVYIVDLEENRVIETLDHRHHQTIPTLLWV